MFERFVPSAPTFALLAALAAGSGSAAAAAPQTKFFSQKPTVAESRVRAVSESAPAAETKPAAGKSELLKGPKANWIWGSEQAEGNESYVFRKEFTGRSKAATLIAACDNVMTVYINGQRVASGSDWQSPVKVDVQKFLKPRNNVILVEAANQGGPAGLALKLVRYTRDGERRDIVSDKSWQAAPGPARPGSKNAKEWAAVHVLGTMGTSPWGDVFAKAGQGGLPEAPRNVFNVLPGFQVELLYTVPKETQGSWVSITFDDKGRIIASDQGKEGLYRITPSPIGSDQPTKVEKLDVEITAAQGMLYAFDRLYLSVNGGPGSGFYVARDTDGDDQFDQVEKLKPFKGGGEHGPHAIRLSPDGKSLYVVCGNHTDPPENFDASRIPKNWGEDLLLPRQWDARGHARGRLAPGGWVAVTDPEGKTWEMFSIGYRNSYDMDFNADGELFVYDADMEWDFGTPWYRPTRVVHAPSGSEFGWRSGTGKWPPYYVDSLPQMIDIGPGSPTGVTFGYGAQFPAKYQKALYILDWTFGTMYAVHTEPQGASYAATKEEFVSRTPLPLTDAAVGPDGALYFTVGGRGTQSELYRVTYVGKESTAPVDARDEKLAELRELRHKLERYHQRTALRGDGDAPAIDFIWKHVSHPDRHIRYAARVALEHQDAGLWQKRALAEKDPQALITAMVALARQGDKSLQPQALEALERLDFARLTKAQQLELLRVYSLLFIRMGEPDQETAARLARRLDPFYPAQSDELNRELCTLLAYLKSPTVIAKTLELMEKESKPEPAEIAELLARNPGYGNTIAQMLANQPEIDKIHYAFALRTVKDGWTLEQRRQYLKWFESALKRSGGMSYEGFIHNIRKEAIATLGEDEIKALGPLAMLPPPKAAELPKPKGPGRKWTLEELTALTANGLKGRNFENGKRAFAAARCVVCHRFNGSGGATGPDLTSVAGRFSFRDLCESLVDPSKVASDQYRASVVVTNEGQVITGRVVSEQDGKVTILTDPEDGTKYAEVSKADIETITPSKTSLMPSDLLNSLNKDEVLDMLAYLMSRGDPQDRMFAGKGKAASAGR